MKIIFSLFGLAIVAIVIFVIFVIETENAQFRRNAAQADYEPGTSLDSKVLVVYFSRSNNTELMAMEIAKHYEANLVRLYADKYRIGFRGWLNSLNDAQTKHATITPERIDVSQYETIFIGSPIWWYSPAPPAWQFINNNDIADKNIVLFNTFNSKFKQEYIDDFKTKTEEKGGVFVKHIFVKRERMGQQISTEILLEKVRQQIL
jgi:flavodoxin